MILELDTITDGQVEDEITVLPIPGLPFQPIADKTITRAGVVKEIPANASNDPAVLVLALSAPGMPQLGEQHPISPDCYLHKRVVLPANGTDQARIRLIYKNVVGGSPPRLDLLVRDSTVLTQEMVQTDLKGFPLRVNYGPAPAQSKTFAAPRWVPTRNLSLLILMDERPQQFVLDAQGCVNSTPWQGYGAGFWLCAGAVAEDSDIASRIELQLQFWTKIHWDWKSYGHYVDSFGQIPTDVSATDVLAIEQAPYDINQNRANGVTGVGLQPIADFNQIFSFIDFSILDPNSANGRKVRLIR